MQELTRKIDELILSSKKYNEDLNLIDALSFLIQELYDLPEASYNRELLFADSNSISIKKFSAICFIRLIGVSGDTHLLQNMFQVSRLIQSSLPEVCLNLGITYKTETYQLEGLIEEFLEKKEKEFSENLTFNGEIAFLNTFQQTYRRCSSNNINKILLYAFWNELISKPRLDKLFLKMTEYLDARNEDKFQTYKKLKENLDDLILEAKDLNTFYANKFIKEPFENILDTIKKDFEKSPFNLPAKLRIQKTEKKYPLHKGSKNSLNFFLVKDEKGYAFNTNVRIIDFSLDVKFNKSELFVGDVKSTHTIVQFDYEIKRDCNSLLIEVEVTWIATDGIKSTFIELLELSGQENKIDWDAIKLLEPYNLEPVESEVELIGRDNILSRLKTMAVKNIGSSYIYGQRRVGKTSIVKTLLNIRSSPDLLILYIEAGDWNDAQNPFNSMENLGKKICKKIQNSHAKFSSIPIPNFNGSFNNITEFLDQVIEIDSDFRTLIILDEFDRISRELFERGDIGKSFLLTIRSISNRSQFGFILVGGEKLEFILSQWQEFNKFKPVRVDYFSKDEDWNDFIQLIKKPVLNILEISDDAIELIYSKTSGNPYFTKKICIELYNLMVINRDIHVTQKEAEMATIIARNSTNIGATDFSHFWEDGIKGKVEKEEETSLKRRKILIIISNLIKIQRKTTKVNIVDYGLDYGLNKDEIERYLIEFDQRKIIQLVADEYSFFVDFFEEWLLAGGVDKIISSFEEEERLSLTKKIEEEASIKSAEIINLLKNWKIFKGSEITVSHVRNWLEQFDDVFDQRLMFKVLSNVKLYNDFEIREKLEDLFKLVKKQITLAGGAKVLQEGKRKREDILVSYLDDNPSKGGSYYTKIFVDSNNIYKDNSCVPHLLEKRVSEVRNINAVVIIDDFLGSGGSLIENITKYKNEFIYITGVKKIELIFGLIAGFQEGKDKVEKHLQKLNIPSSVFIIDTLDDTDVCFSNSSKIFNTSIERKKAQDICSRIGTKLEKRHPLGYNNCQATIVFPVNCPNNSLPILWKKTDTWIPLFERN